MVKQKDERDERGAAPCKHCKRHKIISYPKIVEVDDLYYARCPKCNYYDDYEFLALSKKKAINVWNITMENKTASE